MQISKPYEGGVFSVEQIEYTARDGENVRRDVVRHPGAVTIIGVLEGGKIVFIRNYRISVDDMLLELPAGKIEVLEQPEAAARRELLEETGYRAESVRRIGAFYTSPGMSDELMHVYLAEGLQPGRQELKPGESIEIEILTRDEGMRLITAGEIRDGKTIAALALWGISPDPTLSPQSHSAARRNQRRKNSPRSATESYGARTESRNQKADNCEREGGS